MALQDNIISQMVTAALGTLPPHSDVVNEVVGVKHTRPTITLERLVMYPGGTYFEVDQCDEDYWMYNQQVR